MADKPKDKDEDLRKLDAGEAPSDPDELQRKIDELMGPEPEKAPPQSVTPATGAKEASTAPPVANEAQLTKKAEPVQSEPVKEPEVSAELGDDETGKAVDDIIKNDSDDLLKAEDEKLAEAFTPKPKPTLKEKVKNFLKAWWDNPKARWATLIGVLLLLAAAFTVPNSRYFMLNTVGVRSSASLVVLDDATQLPLKNVKVTLGGKSSQTDGTGSVRFDKIRLGTNELVIEKRAFAEINRKITIGWGSNPLGDFKLLAVGTQYTFNVAHFLSEKPIEKLEAVSGEASAFSDKEGKIILTLEKGDDAQIATIIGEGWRDEEVALPEDPSQPVKVAMVPARKHAFISKRSGKYDVYKIDVDGRNEEVALAGTGSERDDIALVPHPSANVVGLVSTRDNERNKDGYLLSTLTIIDLSDNTTQEVATAEKIQIVGWVGNRVIFVQTVAGTSAANPNRSRLTSFDYKDALSKELASSNYFNDVLVSGGKVYFAPSSSFQSDENIGVFKINPDGTDKVSVMTSEVWSFPRTSYSSVVAYTGSDWYEYKLGESQSKALTGPPADQKDRVYVDSPDGKRSLWVEERDGKGTLLVYDIAGGEDSVLTAQSGLVHPVRWIDATTIVYRIHTDEESADYVMSTEGGEARKLKDVTNTGGADGWYYY